MPDRCKLCKAAVRWTVDARDGHALQLDLDPSDTGNWRLAAARVFGGTPRALLVPADQQQALGGELYTSHASTCQYREARRKRR
jgi:hypothetical protein